MGRPVSQASGRVASATCQGVGQPRRRASGAELQGLNPKGSKQPWAGRGRRLVRLRHAVAFRILAPDGAVGRSHEAGAIQSATTI